MSIDLKNIRTYTDGKASFMVGLFEELNLHMFLTHISKKKVGVHQRYHMVSSLK